MKKFFIAVAVLVVLFVIAKSVPKHVSGQVLDTDGVGVEGAQVEAVQKDWGFIDGQLVWDKAYRYLAETDKDGKFSLWYFHGDVTSVHLRFSKEGYESTKPGYPLNDAYIDFWVKHVIVLKRIGN